MLHFLFVNMNTMMMSNLRYLSVLEHADKKRSKNKLEIYVVLEKGSEMFGTLS